MQKSSIDQGTFIVDIRDIGRDDVALVGGKAANLGELARVEGVVVPRGFCLTTTAYRCMFAAATQSDAPWNARLERLTHLAPGDVVAIETHSATLRRTIEATPVPAEIAEAIAGALRHLPVDTRWAIRSSATAEDLPTASFAGLHDSYLGVVGIDAVVRHVVLCWASLFSARAAAYRRHHRLDERAIHMAVVLQQMVPADVAGVLFTADPVSGNRRITSIDAVAGLGDALVSGRMTPDTYTLRDGHVLSRAVAQHRRTNDEADAGRGGDGHVGDHRQLQPALSNGTLIRLERMGRRIEAHFGAPQDIEWCLADGAILVVQSRAITTLFPIPVVDDDRNHVYLSVGHQQMMTDALKPLGLSFWQMTTPRPMAEAGGRLFVDVAPMLASPASRANLLEMIGRSDALMHDALQSVLARGDFITPASADAPPAPLAVERSELLAPDAAIVATLVANNRASVEALRRDIADKSGTELFEFIRTDIQELRRHLSGATSHRAVMAGIEATWWLNDRLQEWLGESNAADTLAQSAPDNVTSEMGLALLDVADVLRAHPQVVAFIERASDDRFVDRLAELEGGKEARDAIRHWLDTYGMRGTGEIDITRPRWSEHPAALLPLLRGNIRNFAAGSAAQRFEAGGRAARRAREALLQRVRGLPDGEQKVREVEEMIDRLRTFIGYREYPKFGMVSRYFIYKQSLLREAERLVAAGILDGRDDIFFLRFDELEGVVRERVADQALVRRRREEYAAHTMLRAPRVLTSEGDALEGAYRRDGVPAGALVGLAVSAGVVEGRARVVRELADAELRPGDILVTPYTDPSWTPAFVSIGGLVTEVGGLMTHGAVIAREYGIPAVVAVDRATTRIRDGDRIRVNGSAGYVEVLALRDADRTTDA